MSNHATLSYSGRTGIETDGDGTVPQPERDRLHNLLDDAIAAFEGDKATMKTAVIHFERDRDGVGRNEMPRAHVELETSGGLSELSAHQDSLAQQIKSIGLEPDVETAKSAIEIE